MRVWAIAEDSHMLLKLLNLSLVDRDLLLLVICGEHNIFKPLIENLIFISLSLDITFELLVVFPGLNMKLVLDDLSFFNKDIHHDINFFSDLVCFFFEKL